MSERRLPGAHIDKPHGRSVAEIVANLDAVDLGGRRVLCPEGQQAVTTLMSFHLFVRGPMSKIVFVSLNTKDYTVDTGSVLKPDLVSGAEGPTGARSMRPSSAPAISTAALLRYRHSKASQPEGGANQALPRRGTEGSNPASSGRISYRGFGIYVLGDEAELAPSFRGFAVGAAAERWRETLL